MSRNTHPLIVDVSDYDDDLPRRASTPEGRGFLYAPEARLLVSQDHGVDVHQATITQNLQPPPGWTKSKRTTGSLKAGISWPTKVWEIDLEAFDEFREGFNPRRDPESTKGTYTIAEVANLLNMSRNDAYYLVYRGRIPSIKRDGFRFVDASYITEVQRGKVSVSF